MRKQDRRRKVGFTNKKFRVIYKKKGFNLSELSRKTGVPYMALYNSLMNVKEDRALRAGEYLSLCKHLELDPMIFYQGDQKEMG